MRQTYSSLSQLQAAGFNYEDACALRRISMTLHRWHELECGDSNDYASWVITRGDWKKHAASRAPRQPDGSRWPKEFVHDENGKPFLECHRSGCLTSYEPVPDRERGALRRLAKSMARYPSFAHYVQGDPRGCALYILRPTDLVSAPLVAERAEWLSANYSKGIAVHK